MAHQFWHHDMMPFKGRRITVDVGGGNWQRFLGYAIELGQGQVTDGYVHEDDHYLVVNHEQWGKKTAAVREAIRHFIPIVTPEFIKDACVMRELRKYISLLHLLDSLSMTTIPIITYPPFKRHDDFYTNMTAVIAGSGKYHPKLNTRAIKRADDAVSSTPYLPTTISYS